MKFHIKISCMKFSHVSNIKFYALKLSESGAVYIHTAEAETFA